MQLDEKYLTARSLADRTVIDTTHQCPFRDPALGKQGARRHAMRTRPVFCPHPSENPVAVHQTTRQCNTVPIDKGIHIQYLLSI